MDGSGNDTYIGFGPVEVPAKANLRVRPRVLSRTVRQRLPLDSGVNYFTRSRVASLLHCGCSARDIFAFYPDAVDAETTGTTRERRTTATWSTSSPRRVAPGRSVPRRPEDPHGGTGGGPRDGHAMVRSAIADYYFNLPEADRFDREAKLNKVLLRRALAEALDYDERVVGSRYFDFDPARFMVTNAPFVREEILGCALWGPEVEPMFERWFAALPESAPARPRTPWAVHGVRVARPRRHLTR